EEVGGDAGDGEAGGVAGAGQGEVVDGISGGAPEAAVAVAHDLVGGDGERDRASRVAGVGTAEEDEAPGVAEGQGAEEEGVDDAENGGVGADAEAERQDRDEGEAGGL